MMAEDWWIKKINIRWVCTNGIGTYDEMEHNLYQRILNDKGLKTGDWSNWQMWKLKTTLKNEYGQIRCSSNNCILFLLVIIYNLSNAHIHVSYQMHLHTHYQILLQNSLCTTHNAFMAAECMNMWINSIWTMW